MESSTLNRRASLDRQTKLAHIQLVSKYYGYSTNYSYPRLEGKQAPHNPYRRAGQTFPDQHHSEALPVPQSPQSPCQRRQRARQTDRTSVGSDGSAPSLIDDQSDSDLSHDDDYQYHASTSQLFDSFWVAQDGDEQPPHPESQPRSPKKVSQDKPNPRYPALIPSPHIKRTKKTSSINYDDYPVPPRPVAPARPILVKPGQAAQTTTPEWPIRPPPPPTTSVTEKRKTIRAVKSSYSLFPKHSTPPSTIPPGVPPPPRTSSLPRPATPPAAPPATTTRPRKSSRPQPFHHHSDPAPTTSSAAAAVTGPTPIARPHTSHGMARPRTPTLHAHSPLSPHLCDPAHVTTTLPQFPSTNLADLIHPRAAPHPPTRAPPAPTREPPLPTTPTISHQKSFFDFDSESESESENGQRGISRLVRGRRHKHGQSSTSTVAAAPSSNHASRPSQSLGRKSLDRMRRRSRPPTAAFAGTVATVNHASSRRSHDEDHFGDSEGRENKKEGRKSDVFGRMFGRASRGSN